MEFKETRADIVLATMSNAVAPDWNLKHKIASLYCIFITNAVAPDWNLKNSNYPFNESMLFNAVAPDWNLKLKSTFTLPMIFNQCSRTRLEFKDSVSV